MLFSIVIIITPVFSQHNMLGKSKIYIESFYKLSNNFVLKTDTINKESLLITCRTTEQYPFYTYEIDIKENICISYGIVSKDKGILNTYLELLGYLGELVEVDSTYNNFTYKIETADRLSVFTIKKPYFNSQFLTQRNLFYILISEQSKKKPAFLFNENHKN